MAIKSFEELNESSQIVYGIAYTGNDGNLKWYMDSTIYRGLVISGL